MLINRADCGQPEFELFVEFKLSLLKSNISRPGLVLHAHIHGRCVR